MPNKKTTALNRIGICIFEFGFIWNLVLGICDFKHKTPSQSQRNPIHASRGRHDTKGQDFYNGLKVIS